MEKICNKCKSSGYLQAFSNGKCKLCNSDIITPHIPCYELCEECATTKNRCQQCGESIDVISVVRCKDCYHYYKYSDWDRSRSESYDAWECSLLNKDFGFEGYCSCGENKCEKYIPNTDYLHRPCANNECDKYKTCEKSSYIDEEENW